MNPFPHAGVVDLPGPLARVVLDGAGTITGVIAHHTASVTHRRRITLVGCDESTSVWVDVNPEELEFLEYLAETVNEASGGSCCKPSIKITDSGGYDPDAPPGERWRYEPADNLAEYLADEPGLTAADLGENPAVVTSE